MKRCCRLRGRQLACLSRQLWRRRQEALKPWEVSGGKEEAREAEGREGDKGQGAREGGDTKKTQGGHR